MQPRGNDAGFLRCFWYPGFVAQYLFKWWSTIWALRTTCLIPQKCPFSKIQPFFTRAIFKKISLMVNLRMLQQFWNGPWKAIRASKQQISGHKKHFMMVLLLIMLSSLLSHIFNFHTVASVKKHLCETFQSCSGWATCTKQYIYSKIQFSLSVCAASLSHEKTWNNLTNRFFHGCDEEKSDVDRHAANMFSQRPFGHRIQTSST